MSGIAQGARTAVRLLPWMSGQIFAPAISALPPSVVVVCRKEPATYMDVGSYDSKEGIGRVESGTETESNAGRLHGSKR